MHGHPGKLKSAHSCVSNVLSAISEYADDSFKENLCEERETFVETLIAVLQIWKTMNIWRWRWKKLWNFPTYLMNLVNHKTFHPQNCNYYNPYWLQNYENFPCTCYVNAIIEHSFYPFNRTHWLECSENWRNCYRLSQNLDTYIYKVKMTSTKQPR